MAAFTVQWSASMAAGLLAAALTTTQAGATHIALADQPVRLVRGSAVYKTSVGTPVQKDDIVETGAGVAQLEVSPSLIMMLGPQTSVYLGNVSGEAASGVELVLLRGWLKLMSKGGGAAKRMIVTAPLIRVALDNGVGIVHGAAGKGETFSEEGVAIVNAMDGEGKPGADVKLNREQFALIAAGQGVKVLARPAKDFIAEMPLAFRDPVTPAPDRLKGAHPAAVKEREVDFADVAPWLSSTLALRKSFVGRFAARAKDPIFRKQLSESLGQSPEWKAVLQTPVPGSEQKKRPAAITNIIF